METSSINQVTPNGFEVQLKYSLNRLSPKDILTSKELSTCFESFFERGTVEDCRQLLPHPYRSVILHMQHAIPPSITPNRNSTLHVNGLPVSTSPVSSLSSVSTPSSIANFQVNRKLICTYFESICNDAERAKLLARLVQSFVDGEPRPLARYNHLWCGRVKIFDKKIKARVERLRLGRQKINDNTTEYNCADRLSLLCAVNEVDHYTLTASPEELGLESGRNRKTAGLANFATLFNVDPKELKRDRHKSRNFSSLLYKAGPGSLLEIHTGAASEYVTIPSFDQSLTSNLNHSWERASAEDLHLALEYRKAHFRELDERARRLDAIGACTIVDCLLEYGWTVAQIASSPTPFLKQVRKYLDENLEIPKDQLSALQTLDEGSTPDVGSSSEIVLRNESLVDSVCDDCSSRRTSTRSLLAVQQTGNPGVDSSSHSSIVASSNCSNGTTNHNVYQSRGGASMRLLCSAADSMNSGEFGGGQHLHQGEFSMPQSADSHRGGFVSGTPQYTEFRHNVFDMPQNTNSHQGGFELTGIIQYADVDHEGFNMVQAANSYQSIFELSGIIQYSDVSHDRFNIPQDADSILEGFDTSYFPQNMPNN